MKYYNIGYQSTNYYLINAGQVCLAIDAGWPGTLNNYGKQLRSTGIKINDINYLMVTHFHMDHAGLVQDFKDLGVKFIVFEEQIKYIAKMEEMLRKHQEKKYKPIKMDDNIVMPVSESRKFFLNIGISGEVVHTPGHSDDSISVFLDTGDVFIGDLNLESQIMDNETTKKNSWVKLRKLGVKCINPGHGYALNL